MHKTHSVVTLALISVGAALLLTGCQEEVPPRPETVRPVKTMVVGGESGVRGRTFPAHVEASSQVDLSFRVDGPLIEFPAREGDQVKKGQLVARLDPRDYKLRLDAARADAERAGADYVRYAALYEKDAVSKAQLDQARATRDVTVASRDDAEARLEDTYLRAPFAGQVGKRFVENFQDVQAKMPILSLIDVTMVDLLLDVPESIAAGFRGAFPDQAIAQFDSAPGQEFELAIKEVATQADPVTQTFEVTFQMPQPEGVNLLPGMTAKVSRRQASSEDQDFVLPAVAVFADDAGQSHVWVIDGETHRVQARAVTTGDLVGAEGLEILDGLQAGELIALSGITTLREGIQVEPKAAGEVIPR